ncbi:MAG: hypothetical protein Ct9H90mP15_02860 [Candidatus Neomarinimicrobiota bacterium]|nr:MAG: hypothetical protein Ct9H90mP15_02860 [Candidatus Neomarinimicrobiota bacterium]
MLLDVLSKENKEFSKIKTIYLTNSLNEDVIFDAKSLGLEKETISPIKSLNLNQIGCMYADKTIIVNSKGNNISSRLMKLKVFKNSKNCSVANLEGGDDIDYTPLFSAVDDAIKAA